MRRVKVELGKRSYRILIGGGIFNRFGRYLETLRPGTDAFIVTNALLKKKYGQRIIQTLSQSGFNYRFKLVADSERSKSLETAGSVIRDLAEFDRKRSVFIIAFGGGVIGDLSGFVASVYKRGIKYFQVPTTLLAQVDSAIGGKTALDLDSAKNMVGAFYQPLLVFSETDFLKTLDRKQFSCGMAEVIKYAVIKDLRFFSFLEERYRKVMRGDRKTLESIIYFCSRVKSDIVSRDEKDLLGIRSILNFGHTIGHAIEVSSGYRGYNHGQAVALGMSAAVKLSMLLGMLSEGEGRRIRELIKLYGLPVRMKKIALDKVVRAHYHDKKFSGGKNRFVLIKKIGKPEVVNNIALDLIKESIRSIS
ncbi:MAG: 3-dehydroquinate synthase [Candidatus Omnitrophica bacterium]|jgi:3-dehydroquinate synthase|nr:3-dehydroquinate synthase [Candidatus Omnitrophota bacterium]MDD3274307.1 3-dehydroquinate synthase [Candidatus Omnitrophota bacterium]MDD5077393.1 3-dehydroquinate synthase [Candidatus Omnitrophota bacterium]MDD5724809.1 3-dehydroquinate synthase [Candidatus Omnitrophota bacterium]